MSEKSKKNIKIRIIKDKGSEYCEFEGKSIPIYNMNGKTYFQDSIPVDLLDLDKEAQPREYDEMQARKIASSIEQKVLMQPILTRYDNINKIILVTEGQHRWRAMKEILKRDRIPCIVYLDLDKNLALRCGLEANWIDRARSLSGRDVARKTHALMQETLELIESESPKAQITEQVIMKRLGVTTRANMAKFLLGKITEDLLTCEKAKIKDYVSSRQSKEMPITAINLGYFLRHIIKLRPVEEPFNSSGYAGLREHELLNIIEVTNIFSEMVLDQGKWDPLELNKISHLHAKNICKRHPFETCGYFIARELMNNGGGDINIGSAYVPQDKINWDNMQKTLEIKLNDSIWDEPGISNLRSIEDLRESLDRHWQKY